MCSALSAISLALETPSMTQLCLPWLLGQISSFPPACVSHTRGVLLDLPCTAPVELPGHLPPHLFVHLCIYLGLGVGATPGGARVRIAPGHLVLGVHLDCSLTLASGLPRLCPCLCSQGLWLRQECVASLVGIFQRNVHLRRLPLGLTPALRTRASAPVEMVFIQLEGMYFGFCFVR